MKKVLGVVLCALLSHLTWAQDFEVAPVVMKFQVEPGNIETRKLTVTNHGNVRQRYSLKLADYGVNEEGQKYSLPVGESPRSCADWLTVNPAILDLNPNESATVDVILTVPAGNHQTRWGMIHIQAAKERLGASLDKDQTATGLVVVPRIVVIVKQSPRSNSNYKAKLVGFRELTENFQGKRVFEVTVKNTGDKIVDGELSLAVANMSTAAEEKFKSKKVTVYPGTQRKVKVFIPKQLAAGKYALAAIFDYGHRQPLEATQIMIEQN